MSFNNLNSPTIVSLEGCAPTKNNSVPSLRSRPLQEQPAETTINYVIIDEVNQKKMGMA
ncbi:hypothetical protein [Duncaniella dubosii]|uniref:hypothetical protein n=1 Tax=Duncaniella dubosii TaxID=2518971 RepID=UPI003F661047